MALEAMRLARRTIHPLAAVESSRPVLASGRSTWDWARATRRSDDQLPGSGFPSSEVKACCQIVCCTVPATPRTLASAIAIMSVVWPVLGREVSRRRVVPWNGTGLMIGG
jgi:hypothetical protein